MTAEEFQVARDFYDETLALAPMFPDALLGKLRALTYLTRAEDAMAVADELLAISRYPGDAHYWKAYNELSLERYDAAWLDIEAAESLAHQQRGAEAGRHHCDQPPRDRGRAAAPRYLASAQP